MAPVSGTIGKILETNHAFSIRTDSGTELFVHFGINTVDLRERVSGVLPRRPADQHR